MSDELDAVEALAVDFAPLTASLSPIALAVFNYAWGYLNSRANWINYRNPFDVVTDSQWDTIEAYVAQAYAEIDLSIMIGQVTAYITEFPPQNVLALDGATLLRVNYPYLYAVIDPAWIIDADTFQLPDLRNRVIVGAGDDYVPADTGGADSVTLSVGEMPSHAHTDLGHSHSIPLVVGLPAQAGVGFSANQTVPILTASTGLGFASLLDTGGDGAHENRQPYMALNYGVVYQ